MAIVAQASFSTAMYHREQPVIAPAWTCAGGATPQEAAFAAALMTEYDRALRFSSMSSAIGAGVTTLRFHAPVESDVAVQLFTSDASNSAAAAVDKSSI
jgi:hypothetical protein